MLAVFFIVRAVRVFRRKRIVGSAFNAASALAMILAAVCVALIGIGLHGFERLTYERTAAEVRFTKTADTKFENNWSTKGNVNPATGKKGTRVTPPSVK